MPRQTIKEPIYRGCKAEICFCTGKCREIIGYTEREMTLKEILKSNKKKDVT